MYTDNSEKAGTKNSAGQMTAGNWLLSGSKKKEKQNYVLKLMYNVITLNK